MKLVLTGFSQEVSVSNPNDVHYYLTFLNSDTGKPIKLPVQQQTTETLILEVYGQKEEVKVESLDVVPADRVDDSDAVSGTEFGGDYSDSVGWEGYSGELEEDVEEELDSLPESEDEIPSL